MIQDEPITTSGELFDAMLAAKRRARGDKGHDDTFVVDCGRVDTDRAQTHLVPLALNFTGADYGMTDATFKGRVTFTFKRVEK